MKPYLFAVADKVFFVNFKKPLDKSRKIVYN